MLKRASSVHENSFRQLARAWDAVDVDESGFRVFVIGGDNPNQAQSHNRPWSVGVPIVTFASPDLSQGRVSDTIDVILANQDARPLGAFLGDDFVSSILVDVEDTERSDFSGLTDVTQLAVTTKEHQGAAATARYRNDRLLPIQLQLAREVVSNQAHRSQSLRTTGPLAVADDRPGDPDPQTAVVLLRLRGWTVRRRPVAPHRYQHAEQRGKR